MISQAKLKATPILLMQALFKRSTVVDFSNKKLSINDFSFDQHQLERYQRTFAIEQHHVPPSFLFVASLNAQLSLLLDDKNKLTVLGLIHRSISFTQFSKIELNAQYHLDIEIVNEQRVANGDEFTVYCQLKLNNKCICHYRSVYLLRDTTKRKRKVENTELYKKPHKNEQSLIISEKDSRHYASVSKDYNLIHIHKYLSRMFGYKKPIIHGMYLVGHMMPKELILGKNVCFTFIRPVLLPNELYYRYSNTFSSLVTNEGKPVLEMTMC